MSFPYYVFGNFSVLSIYSEVLASGSGIRQIGCDFPKGKVKFTGDYTKHQCGLLIRDLNAKDRGIWMCEVEKYYTGFSRRYVNYLE